MLVKDVEGEIFLKSTVRRFSYVISMVLISLFVITLPLLAAEIIILHTNDVHSRLESHLPQGASEEIGGRVRLATVVEQVRNEYGAHKVLLLDAGDSIHGTNIDNLFGGLPSIEIMGVMGYDAFTLGNHEFNYGQAILSERIGDASFPTVAANVTKEDGSLFTGNSAIILQTNGVRVGIIGLVAEETPIVTHPKNVEGLVFHDPLIIAKNVVKSLRPRVDLLIVLSHLGYDKDVQLAEVFSEIDVIVGGHSHTKLDHAKRINGVLIVQSHEYANSLGFLRLEMEDKEIVNYESKLIPVTADVPKNREVQAIVDRWNDRLQQRLGEVIGDTSTSWDGERASVRTGETNLGNLVADIIKNATGADIAFTNGGGIRASMHPGDIRISDIYNVLPFDNTLTVVELLGMDIIDALEHGVRLYPEENGGFLQVSGITFEVVPSGHVGGRIINVKFKGRPIAAGNYYTVATNDFLAAGGDGYEMMKNGRLVADTGIMLRDLVVDYFSEHCIKEPEAGRIIVVQ